ncbi:hypothetical protein SAMN04487914_11172 [Arthrobacter sp. ok909]|uniref:hypothetical protein n=1 Tax=Arthrobacter sp. ok909 TaxID=1761746 RepID=UPI0008913313|nr:hypothetical protein [Arthrobacter sp. ok909]SDP43351.1 hypothetical protein SAMN04487914_11172 [Arthrobacter sp. ok909]
MTTPPMTRQARDGSLPARPVPDWSKLSRNDLVHVRHGNDTPVTGRIDVIAADRSVFWLIQSAGLGRVMICSADHPEVIKMAA